MERDTRNAVRCSHCGATIESTHVHDFRGCLCTDPAKRVCVDGGPEYARRVFGEKASWTELGKEDADA